MAITLNAKGTTNPFFKIGKRGITIYQGTTSPDISYTVSQGDIWLDTTSNLLKFRNASNAWIDNSPAVSIDELTDVDTTSNVPTLGQILEWDGTNFVPTDNYTDANVTSHLLSFDGNIIPTTDDTYTLGSTTNKWLNVYASNANVDSLTVGGDLVVSGTVTAIDTQNLTVADNIIILNNDVTGTPTEDAGLEIERGTSTNVSVAWNETTDRWTFTNDGTTYFNLATNSDDILEGSANLYYTDARFDTKLAQTIDIVSNTPTAGQMLVWDNTNSKFIPGDVFSSSDISVSSNTTAANSGAISYDNATSVFTYTPPDLSSYLSSVAFSDITSKPTTIAGYGITDAFSGSYTDLANKPTVPTSLLNLNITDGTIGQMLITNGAGAFSFSDTYSDADARTAISVAGNLNYNSSTGAISYYANIIEDTTPQLGGNLDLNSNDITGTGNIITTGALTVTGDITTTNGTVTMDRLALSSTQTTVSPLQLTAGTLQDGVGALRIDSVEPDIYLNDTNSSGHSTVTFATMDTAAVAIGKDSSENFYITVRDDNSNSGGWRNDTLVIDNTTGNISLGYDQTVSGTITQGNTDYCTKQYVLSGTTTDATETELFVRGISSNRIPVATDTTIFYDISFVARRTDAAGESAGFELKGVVDNFSGTVADVGDLYEILVASDNVNLAVEATADDTNNAIKVTVTGEASKTFRWTAIVKTTEVAQ